MNNYMGKVCPFCKTEFKEEDSIVVCSSCDMPHHKECWIENQGCTTFGCMGTIKAADGAYTSVTATEILYEDSRSASPVFCTNCGAQNASDSAFCIKCGNGLQVTPSAPVYTQANPANTNPYAYTQQNYNPQPTYTQPTFAEPTYAQPTYTQPTYTQPAYTEPNYTQPNYTQPNYAQPNYAQPAYTQPNYTQPNYAQPAYTQPTYGQQNYYGQNAGTLDADLLALIGSNREYYAPRFQNMKAKNTKASWNWMAFLFTPYWFMYRKMYGYGFAALGVALLILLIGVPGVAYLSLGGYVVMGIFANAIYMHWLESRANQVKMMSEPFRTQFIQKNGGVNGTALTLTIIGWVVVATVISLI